MPTWPAPIRKIFTRAKRTPGPRGVRATATVRVVRVLTSLALVGVFASLVVSSGAACSARLPSPRSGAPCSHGVRRARAPDQRPGEPGGPTSSSRRGRIIRLRRRQEHGVPRRPGQVDYGGERGLLGLAFHPGYASNRLFYVAYTRSGGKHRRPLPRRTAPGDPVEPEDPPAVPDPYSNHNGGNLAFGPDGMLYTTIGDGGSGGDPEDRSQDMQLSLREAASARRLQGGRGLDDRRGSGSGIAWRFSFDRATGDLYIGDVGQNAIEEIDFTPRLSPGLENYGWDLYEGSQRYEDGDAGPGQAGVPRLRVLPRPGVCTVIGGYVYRGEARPARAGEIHLRRLLQRRVWSLRCVGRGEGRAPRALPHPWADVVRRGPAG